MRWGGQGKKLFVDGRNPTIPAINPACRFTDDLENDVDFGTHTCLASPSRGAHVNCRAAVSSPVTRDIEASIGQIQIANSQDERR